MNYRKATRVLSLCVLLVAGVVSPGKAQDLLPPSADRISVGLTGGLFRISYDDFDRFYGGRSGFAWGAHATYRVITPYNIVVKYRSFDKSNDYRNGSQQFNLSWRERWIDVGLRYMGLEREAISSYFSFGFSFFDIRERGGASVFSGVLEQGNSKKTTASGFFIDLGLHYPLMRRLAVNFDFEISSAGVKGKSGFEGSSVGGFFFGLGVVAFLF